jgi:hypothetical protein
MRQRLTDAESNPNLTPRAPTRTPTRAPSPQAQSDAANTAEQAPAAAADAQLPKRSEAIIATRPNPACIDAASLHDQPFADEPNGTAAGIRKLADRLLASMLLAALRPDTIPALLRTITSQQHPAVSSYLHTVRHDLGHENAQPTLAGILTATDTIARCARDLFGPDAYAALTTAIDDVDQSLTKLRHAVDPASFNLHESALARQLLDGVTNPTTDTDQCAIAKLAATYVRKAAVCPDAAKLPGLAARTLAYAPTLELVPQQPAPATPGTSARFKTGTENAGRGNGKGTSPTCLPCIRSAALDRRYTRTPQDANGNNVSNALCSKRHLPSATGHCASSYPTVHATQDQRMSKKARTEEKANMELATTAASAQHTYESAEPYLSYLAAPAEERAMDTVAMKNILIQCIQQSVAPARHVPAETLIDVPMDKLYEIVVRVPRAMEIMFMKCFRQPAIRAKALVAEAKMSELPINKLLECITSVRRFQQTRT